MDEPLMDAKRALVLREIDDEAFPFELRMRAEVYDLTDSRADRRRKVIDQLCLVFAGEGSGRF